jgi:iron complex transport system substrate-binding protein
MPAFLRKTMFPAAFAALFALLAGGFIFSACSRGPSSGKAPAKAAGLKTPQRIVSIAPGVTEAIFFLGEQRRLVGRTDHCNYPPDAKKIPSIGGFGEPSIERIVALKPDLVLMTNSSAYPSYSKLKSLGLNVVDLEPQTLDDVFEMVIEIGRMLGVERKAKERVAMLRKVVETVRARHAREPRAPRVYVEIDYGPIFTVGKQGFLNDMADILGCNNIFADIDQAYPQVGVEAVILRDPEVIFLGHGTHGESALERVRARPGWERISAVRSGRVFGDLDPDLYHRPSPRLVQGLLEMEERIYGKQ